MAVKVLKADEGQFIISDGAKKWTLAYYIHNGLHFSLPDELRSEREHIWEQLFALVGHEHMMDDDDE